MAEKKEMSCCANIFFSGIMLFAIILWLFFMIQEERQKQNAQPQEQYQTQNSK